ncbi:IclR family transcriptional regulator [Humitalea rosea]|uniref:IclR family transcriptional regulator n=1 Tax=Humitalea rosea TaxID=990373 RepID=A0A2W7HU61_9PROT|nr:IclR family transcriptional regulator C-terminal domain-containing protein [Humitalea rosea]PZW37747.1 IclR family transcriptional regulator [Humitalea rosea]
MRQAGEKQAQDRAHPVEGRGVQSIETGGRLLDAMIVSGQPAMLRDLAAAAGIAPAQAHAYLVSFRKIGMVEQDPLSGRYLLGPMALQLGLSRMRSFDPLRLACNAAIDLARDMGLMVTVSVWGMYGPTIIQVQEAVEPVHVNLRAGAVFTLSGTATGRLFAALMPEPIVAPLLRQEMRGGSPSIGKPTAVSALPQSSEVVRRLGYATTEGVPVPGVNAIAVPVLDHAGQLVFALTVIGHAAMLDVGIDGAQLAQVLAVGRKLSAQLGHRDAPRPEARATVAKSARKVAIQRG